MSRIGKKPVEVPAGVTVALAGSKISVEGKLGKLQWEHHPQVAVKFDGDAKLVTVDRHNESRLARSLHGLTRAMIQNMVHGVSKGYEKKLEVVGVGYLAAVDKGVLQLRVGFANEVHKSIPEGLTVKCPDQTHIVITGTDKQMVGQFAAEVRAARKPEPYKGKGIRYEGEVVRRKAGKAVTK
ncbi:MAG: 50S ribosomal protein L6 [Pirellulales bacterium]